jgi:hypothetical protein
MTIILTNAGTAAVNGTYTLDNNGGSYFHSNGIYAIVPDPDTGQTWSVVNMVENARYYSSTIPVNQTPTSFTTAVNTFGDGPAPTVALGGGGGASAPVMKIVKKTVEVIVIEGASLYPQINGIYYLANPGNGYDSFFSKDGGDSYPRIIFYFQAFDNGDYPYFIKINPGDSIYYGTGDYPEGWPGVSDFNNVSWYFEASGNIADITSSSSTADRAYVYKTGNAVYVSYNMNATVLGDIIP